MPTDYWAGFRQAQLTSDQVTASWGRRGVAHSGTAITFVNRAFELYYQAHQRIESCPDGRQRQRMLEELHDAGRSGWGRGVDDLEEAFQHLDGNGGRWTDEATWNYYGGRNKVYQIMLVTAPTSIVNFMNAVDSRMERLREAAERFHRQAQQVNQAERANRWEQVGQGLEQIGAWGGRAEPFMWMAPSVQARVGQTVSFAGALSNLHAGLTTYGNAIRAGMPPTAATALAGLRAALGWVPVLGDFYGRAVELIPGLAVWYRRLHEDYTRRVDRAAAGRH